MIPCRGACRDAGGGEYPSLRCCCSGENDGIVADTDTRTLTLFALFPRSVRLCVFLGARVCVCVSARECVTRGLRRARLRSSNTLTKVLW